MQFKIKSGTRSAAHPLCNTCRWAVVIKGAAESQELIRCGAIDQMIPFPVVECSDYANKNDAELRDMRQIAWVVDTNRRRVGFMSPEKWRKQNPSSDPLINF